MCVSKVQHMTGRKTGCNRSKPVFFGFSIFWQTSQLATEKIQNLCNHNRWSGLLQLGSVRFRSFFQSSKLDLRTLGTTAKVSRIEQDWGTLRIAIGKDYINQAFLDKQKAHANCASYRNTRNGRENPSEYIIWNWSYYSSYTTIQIGSWSMRSWKVLPRIGLQLLRLTSSKI